MRVPRWRTRIVPAVTSWPPWRLTPSRLAAESRPLRLEDAPFLCAISAFLFLLVLLLLLGLAARAGRALSAEVDRLDLEPGQGLAVAEGAALAGLVLVGEDADLLAPVLVDHTGRDLDLGQVLGRGGHLAVVVDDQQRLQLEAGAVVAAELLDVDEVTDLHLVLLPAGPDDGVHLGIVLSRWGRRQAGSPGRRPQTVLDLVRDHHAAAVAGRAGLGEAIEQAARDALAGHLDQAEGGDLHHLALGLVPDQGGPEAVDHGLLVALEQHVDEVDDDDAADVAQAELADDLVGRLEVVGDHRLLEVGLADELAGVDVDDGHGLGAVDHDRAAGGQPDLALQGLVDLLDDPVVLEHRQLALVLAELGQQVGRDLGQVLLDPLVEVVAVDHQLDEVGREDVADDPHDQLGLGVDDGRGGGLLGLALDRLPAGLEAGQVGPEVVGAGALGGGADDQAEALGPDLLEDVAQARPLGLGQAAGDAEGVVLGLQDQVAAGQGDLGGQARPLGPDRVLGDLDEHGLAGLEDLLDSGGLAVQVLLVVVDLAGVQDRVAAAADVDEGGLHAGQDVLDPAQVDVADHGAAGLAGHVVLDQGRALEHADLGPFRALGDDHAAVRALLAEDPLLLLGQARGAAPAPLVGLAGAFALGAGLQAGRALRAARAAPAALLLGLGPVPLGGGVGGLGGGVGVDRDQPPAASPPPPVAARAPLAGGPAPGLGVGVGRLGRVAGGRAGLLGLAVAAAGAAPRPGGPGGRRGRLVLGRFARGGGRREGRVGRGGGAGPGSSRRLVGGGAAGPGRPSGLVARGGGSAAGLGRLGGVVVGVAATGLGGGPAAAPGPGPGRAADTSGRELVLGCAGVRRGRAGIRPGGAVGRGLGSQVAGRRAPEPCGGGGDSRGGVGPGRLGGAGVRPGPLYGIRRVGGTSATPTTPATPATGPSTLPRRDVLGVGGVGRLPGRGPGPGGAPGPAGLTGRGGLPAGGRVSGRDVLAGPGALGLAGLARRPGGGLGPCPGGG